MQVEKNAQAIHLFSELSGLREPIETTKTTEQLGFMLNLSLPTISAIETTVFDLGNKGFQQLKGCFRRCQFNMSVLEANRFIF